MTGNRRFLSTSNLLRISGSVLSIALLVYLISRQGWPEMVARLRAIPVPSLVGVLALMAASRIAVSLRWYSLLHAIDSRFPYLESLRLTFAGLFAANFLPTTVGGDVVRLAGVLEAGDSRMDRVTSIAADRLVGLFGMALVLPLGIVEGWSWMRATWLTAQLFHTGALLAAVPLNGSVISKNVQRLRGILGRALTSLTAWIHRPRAVLTALGFTLLHMVCLFSILSILLRGMGDRVAISTIAGLWSLTYFVSLMPFSIAGLGIREVTVTLVFQEVAGISPESALTLAILLRLLEMLASLPGSLFIPGILAAMRSAPEAQGGH